MDESNLTDVYKTILCSACGTTHEVNPPTGRVIGNNEDNKSQE